MKYFDIVLIVIFIGMLSTVISIENIYGVHDIIDDCDGIDSTSLPESELRHHHHYITSTIDIPQCDSSLSFHYHHAHITIPSEEPPENNKNGSGCTGDCTPPTLGLNSNGQLLVKDGITINGISKDGGYFHTVYPMRYTNLHQQNNISLKYYENSGVQDISIVQLGIGVKEIGTPISESQALIEVHMDYFSDDIDNPIIKKIIVIDPDEILHDVSASVQLSTCSESYDTDTVNVKLSDSFSNNDREEFYRNLINNTCLSVDFNYSYGLVPDSPILSSNAIDYNRNSINNYFNDGLTVIDSNPIKKVIPEEESYQCNDVVKPSMNRNNCVFELLKQLEIQRAQDTFNKLYGI